MKGPAHGCNRRVRSALFLSLVILLSSCAAPARAPGAQGTGDPAPEVKPAPPVADNEMVGDGSPDGAGKLPMATVEQHMGKVRDSVKACADATTYEGKVSVRVVITPAGAPTAKITQGSGEANIDECVVHAFADVTFPTSERGQSFVYSFTF